MHRITSRTHKETGWSMARGGSRGDLGGRRGASDSACVHLTATPLTPLEFPLLPLADGPPLLAFFLHMPSPSAASHSRRILLEGHTDRSLVRHLRWQHGPDQPGGEGFVTCESFTDLSALLLCFSAGLPPFPRISLADGDDNLLGARTRLTARGPRLSQPRQYTDTEMRIVVFRSMILGG